jgi:ABC-type branched-subunit amino acid transport system substrate-binding protein
MVGIRFGRAAVVVGLALGVFGPARAHDTVTIAAILGLTGPTQGCATEALNGITLAAEEINAQGGVLGKPLQVIAADHRDDAQAAVSSVVRLVSTHDVQALLDMSPPEVSAAVAVALQDMVRGLSTLAPDLPQTVQSAFPHISATPETGAVGARALDRERPAVARFLGAYAHRFTAQPGTRCASTLYDATYMLSLAMEDAGGLDGEKIHAGILHVAEAPGVPILPGAWSEAVKAIAAGQSIAYDGSSRAKPAIATLYDLTLWPLPIGHLPSPSAP